jgi:hypothetical protein
LEEAPPYIALTNCGPHPDGVSPTPGLRHKELSEIR